MTEAFKKIKSSTLKSWKSLKRFLKNKKIKGGFEPSDEEKNWWKNYKVKLTDKKVKKKTKLSEKDLKKVNLIKDYYLN